MNAKRETFRWRATLADLWEDSRADPYRRILSATFTRGYENGLDLAQVLRVRVILVLFSGYMTRWALYRMLESTLERFGSGRACLLRVVCESAAYPFDKGHGLLGELLHVLLTPSTTREEYEIYSNREYHAAEVIGRNTRGRCAPFYPECGYNPLDYFTRLTVWVNPFFRTRRKFREFPESSSCNVRL